MGNETSKYEGPPEVLEGRDLASVAKYMKSKRCKRVFVMLGAGVSTSAGIPDFRSPDTGLYANLAKLKLPYPEAVFEINFFRSNPLPFYTLARELMPGNYRPTLTHSFVRLLSSRMLLHTCFTQNIDTLERLAGIPPEKIVEAHGSFANQRCIECQVEYEGDKLKEHIQKGQVATCEECGGYVKPDIVFFGESLPQRFHLSMPSLRSADLLIVMGTSLTVQPFASLASIVPQSCPRVLINLDLVGDFGSRPDDVICLGKTDDIVRELCRELGNGWEEQLDALWNATEGAAVMRAPEEERKPVVTEKEEEEPSKVAETVEQQRLQDEIDKMTSAVEKSLQIGEVPTTEEAEPREDDKEELKLASESKSKIPNSQPEDDDGETSDKKAGTDTHSPSGDIGREPSREPEGKL